MTLTAVIVKLMPTSPEVNLKEIENSSKFALEKHGAMNISFEQKPIAFGLKAILIKFAWPEESGTDTIEAILSKIKNVSSVRIEDYRRAFG